VSLDLIVFPTPCILPSEDVLFPYLQTPVYSMIFFLLWHIVRLLSADTIWHISSQATFRQFSIANLTRTFSPSQVVQEPFPPVESPTSHFRRPCLRLEMLCARLSDTAIDPTR
jgi:hypothetical protein